MGNESERDVDCKSDHITAFDVQFQFFKLKIEIKYMQREKWY